MATVSTTAQTIIKTAGTALLLIGISPLLPVIGIMWAMAAFEAESIENSTVEGAATSNLGCGYGPDSRLISLKPICG